MRIVSWNVNGIRAAEESPDMLYLQETKAEPAQLSEEVLHLKDKKGAMYHAYWAIVKSFYGIEPSGETCKITEPKGNYHPPEW